MTSARILYSLLTVVTVTGVATTLVPALRAVVAIGGLVAGVLAVAIAVASLVAVEVRWNREIDRLIAEPLPVAIDRDEVAR
jgi:hypothetical protein